MVPRSQQAEDTESDAEAEMAQLSEGPGDFVVGAGQVSPRVRCVIGIPVIEMTVKNPSP